MPSTKALYAWYFDFSLAHCCGSERSRTQSQQFIGGVHTTQLDLLRTAPSSFFNVLSFSFSLLFSNVRLAVPEHLCAPQPTEEMRRHGMGRHQNDVTMRSNELIGNYLVQVKSHVSHRSPGTHTKSQALLSKKKVRYRISHLLLHPKKVVSQMPPESLSPTGKKMSPRCAPNSLPPSIQEDLWDNFLSVAIRHFSEGSWNIFRFVWRRKRVPGGEGISRRKVCPRRVGGQLRNSRNGTRAFDNFEIMCSSLVTLVVSLLLDHGVVYRHGSKWCDVLCFLLRLNTTNTGASGSGPATSEGSKSTLSKT